MKLLKFKRDWRDEFDAEGYRLMSNEEYTLWNRAVQSVAKENCYFYFGTNEGWDEGSISEMLDYIEVSDVCLEAGLHIMLALRGIESHSGIGQFPDTMLEDCEETDEVEAYWAFINKGE